MSYLRSGRGTMLAALLLVVPAVSDQKGLDQLPSAARAVVVVGRAIDAMGGLAELQRGQDVSRELSGIRPDTGQGLRAGEPSNDHPQMTSIIDLKNQRISMRVRDHY